MLSRKPYNVKGNRILVTPPLLRISYHFGGVFPVPVIFCPDKHRKVKRLPFMYQGKACCLFRFQAAVGAQSNRWLTFDRYRDRIFEKFSYAAFEGFVFLFRIIPVNGVKRAAFQFDLTAT